MPHVIHECEKTPEGLLDTLAAQHGWNRKEIPLNTDAGHDVCPYCKKPVSEMQPLGADDVFKLNKNLKAKGTAGAGGVSKADNATLLAAIKSLEAKIAKMEAKPQ